MEMIRPISLVAVACMFTQLVQAIPLEHTFLACDRAPQTSLTELFVSELHPGHVSAGFTENEDAEAWEGLEPALPSAGALDSSRVDSVAHHSARKLLPDNMSVMERWIWSEDGMVRNLGIASPLTPEVRKSELQVRRTMLTAHQIGGFTTLGLMLATVYFGQKALDTGLRSDRNAHQTFVAFTIGSYAATAFLSVLSPPPVIRRDETSTTTIHKTLAWIHFAGMIATPILGKMINRRGSSYYDRARVHQVAAYVTTAVFAASMIVVTF